MRKPLVEALAQSPETRQRPPAAEPASAIPPSRRGTKAMTVHVDPAASKAMRQLALDLDTTLQALLTDAVNDCLAKHGKPPIA